MRLGNDTPASIHTLADAEYYALSPREQLAYLTRILLELDRLQRRTLREQPGDAEPGEGAPSAGTYSRRGSFRDAPDRTSSSAIR